MRSIFFDAIRAFCSISLQLVPDFIMDYNKIGNKNNRSRFNPYLYSKNEYIRSKHINNKNFRSKNYFIV